MTAPVFYPHARAFLSIVFDGFAESAKDTPPENFFVTPISATVHKNSFRQANSWEITFSAKDMPIDPQLIRAGSAEIFLFETEGLSDDPRIVSNRLAAVEDPNAKNKRDPSDALEVELEMRAAADKFAKHNNPMIVGIFDQASVEMTDGGKWVTLSGQDYTAFLIAKKWPVIVSRSGTKVSRRQKRVPARGRLDRIVQDIVSEADDTGRLRVRLDAIGPQDVPTLGQGEVAGNKRGIPAPPDATYWDVVYMLTSRYGLRAYVDGLDIVITKPKNITDLNQHDIKEMAWGKNIEALSMSRNIGSERVPRIIVKSYDDKSREVVTVEYPQHGETIPTDGLGLSSDEFRIVPLYGIKDRKVLQNVAQALFETLGKAERTFVATTRDLRDGNGRNMMDLNFGDAVNIEFVDFDKSYFANSAISASDRFQHLLDHGFAMDMAQIIAEQYDLLFGIKRPMSVREVSYSYDAESGIDIEMELIDFITIDGSRNPLDRIPGKTKTPDKVRDGRGNSIGNAQVESFT